MPAFSPPTQPDPTPHGLHVQPQSELRPRDRLHHALEASGIGAWEWNPASNAIKCNRRMRCMCGWHAAPTHDLDSFLDVIHSADRPRVRDILDSAARDDRRHHVEFRLADTRGAREKWIALDGRSRARSHAVRVIGTARDVSAYKARENRNRLLVHELEHRIVNVFTVMTSITSLVQRSASTPEEFGSALLGRIGALARAHRQLGDASGDQSIPLRNLVEAEIEPFADFARVSIDGPPLTVARQARLAMTLIVHELITNAIKHGALACPGGRLSIEWSVATSHGTDDLVLHWKESGAVGVAIPARDGSGSRLLSISARSSLRGDISLDFQPDGLLATLVVPIGTLLRPQS